MQLQRRDSIRVRYSGWLYNVVFDTQARAATELKFTARFSRMRDSIAKSIRCLTVSLLAFACDKIPLYPYSAKTAQERGEIEKWRESFRENCACAGGIDVLIRENFDGMHLKDGTVEKIVELYGYKRVEHVLANTVQERRGDGRFRPDNRAWAESHYIPEDEMHNYCFAARSHSAILDGFISHYRKLVMNLGMFDQKQCEPDSSDLDYTGKVLVLAPNTLKEEYWSPENQLWLVI